MAAAAGTGAGTAMVRSGLPLLVTSRSVPTPDSPPRATSLKRSATLMEWNDFHVIQAVARCSEAFFNEMKHTGKAPAVKDKKPSVLTDLPADVIEMIFGNLTYEETRTLAKTGNVCGEVFETMKERVKGIPTDLVSLAGGIGAFLELPEHALKAPEEAKGTLIDDTIEDLEEVLHASPKLFASSPSIRGVFTKNGKEYPFYAIACTEVYSSYCAEDEDFGLSPMDPSTTQKLLIILGETAVLDKTYYSRYWDTLLRFDNAWSTTWPDAKPDTVVPIIEHLQIAKKFTGEIIPANQMGTQENISCTLGWK